MWLGIDLGGTNLSVGVVDGSAVVESVTVPSIPKEYSLESSIGYLVEVIRPLCSSDIRGIGIGAPSVVDAEQGIVYDVTNIPQWVEVPLKAILEKAFPSKKVRTALLLANTVSARVAAHPAWSESLSVPAWARES